jgi:hypothetical protein
MLPTNSTPLAITFNSRVTENLVRVGPQLQIRSDR